MVFLMYFSVPLIMKIIVDLKEFDNKNGEDWSVVMHNNKCLFVD